MSLPPTLLLADDSLIIQRVVSLTFAEQAIRVVVARDGQDAINRMASEPPDVVLADTNMPCVDGYELARWVRQQPHLSTVPVLLLAGATDPLDEQRLRDSGANGVLEKPFEPTQVMSRVKELLGMKGVVTVPPGRLVTTGEPPPAVRAPAPPPAAGAPEPPPMLLDAPPSPAVVPPSASVRPLPSPPNDVEAAWRSEREADTTVEDPAALLPQQLDDLAALVVARLRPAALREDLERGLALGLRETVARTLQESVAAETRAAVAEAVQSSVNGSILGTIRGAVNEAVAGSVPAAVEQQLGRELHDRLREAVASEVRASVLPAVQQTVREVLLGEPGRLAEVVHDTAERLVREEIARIRERRA